MVPKSVKYDKMKTANKHVLLGLVLIGGFVFLLAAPFLIFGFLGGLVFYLIVDAILRR